MAKSPPPSTHQNLHLYRAYAWSCPVLSLSPDSSDCDWHWNRVGSSGSTGLKIIWVWPGLDHVRQKLRKAWYGRITADATATFAYHEPHPLFEAMIFTCCKCTPLISCMHIHAKIAIYSLHRATPINLMLQEFYTCSMPGNIHMQQTYSSTKPLPPIQATFLCLQAYGTHTYRSIEISICLSWVYIARYLQSVVSTISERVLQFTNPGHIQVWLRLLSGPAVATWFQSWLWLQELIIEHARTWFSIVNSAIKAMPSSA